MSRVHKYQAWVKNQKVMVEVDELRYFPDDNDKLQLENIWVTFPNSLTRQLRKLEDVELMEFTGLLDKNDKEIYEGDIVTGEPPHYLEKVKGVVKYCGMAFAFVGKTETGKTWFDTTTNPNIKKADVEIIGNIFENPEYLEE